MRREPQANLVQLREIFESSDEEAEAYPVQAKRGPGRPRKTPYDRTKGKEREGSPPPPRNEARDVAFEDEVLRAIGNDAEDEDAAMHEESNAGRRLRKTKTYEFNAWEALKDTPVPIKWGELTQLSSTVKQQVRDGLSKSRPEHKIVEARTAKPGWQSPEKKDEQQESQEIRHTSAYATCQIEDKVVSVIIDTGAGVCLLSKPMLDRLEWEIEASTKLTITVADGHEAVPLGRVFSVPVKFGPATINMDMIVVDTTSYELVLGNDFFKKTKAVIDLNAEKMRIRHRGR